MATSSPNGSSQHAWHGGRAAIVAVIVAALGYFVDIYDLILFSMVRRPSLAALGVTDPNAMVSDGVFLLNMQMIGMLVGGILWGILGDRRGRLSVLFGSILMYSLANVANGLVTDVPQYAVCRVIAGIGLAGELGAGVTLVAELMPKRTRGWGTTVVAFVGVCGCLAAAIIGGALPQVYQGAHWRTAYFIGGGLGLALLVLRIGVVESGMFRAVQASAATRGNFFALFATRERARRYLAVVAIGVPIWFIIGILVTLGDAIGLQLGLPSPPRPATALFFCYAGLALGDLAAGVLSQLLQSRRKAFATFLLIAGAAGVAYYTVGARSLTWFYASCFALGIGGGYWAVFVTTASELFGTNLRATATTTAPNFVRGSLVPASILFEALRAMPSVGIVKASLVVGGICMGLALLALVFLPETFGRDLDFIEE